MEVEKRLTLKWFAAFLQGRFLMLARVAHLSIKINRNNSLGNIPQEKDSRKGKGSDSYVLVFEKYFSEV